jgi:hypothetical protein
MSGQESVVKDGTLKSSGDFAIRDAAKLDN